MSHSNKQLLIDYLDNRLEGQELLRAEQLIQEDGDATEEFEHLQFAVKLIREAGITAEVAAARKEFERGAIVRQLHKEETGAVVRPMFIKKFLRVAAVVFLMLGAASVYKYAITNTNSVFDQNFTSFDLNSSRGANNDGEMEKAYRNKDWASVKNNFKALSLRSPKAWFLKGMAEMETKNYEAAIADFQEVLNINQKETDQYYQDEAEYYQAMAYIGANKPAEGVAILKKIRADKNHLFHDKASEIPAWDLALLTFKESK